MARSIGKWVRIGVSMVLAAGGFSYMAPAMAQTTVAFQEGVGGYTGMLDIFISQNAGSIPNGGPDGNVLGSTVAQKFVDGRYAERPDGNTEATIEVQYLFKYDAMFGSGPGQIPLGAKILDASMRFTSGDGGNAQTNGDWALGQMLVPFDATSTWNSLSNGFNAGAAFIGGASARPLGDGYNGPIAASGALTPVHASTDVTRIVQNWSSGAANHGMLLRPSTTDGWQIMVSGTPAVDLRPKLEVTYTTAPQPTTTVVALQQGVGGYTGTTMAWLQGGLSVGGTYPNQLTTDGATIDSAFIDGPNLADASANDQALIKFANIFASQGGPVPNTATILDAQLVVDTGSAVSSINVHTPGDFSVNRMLVDWNTTSLFTDFGGDGPTEAQNEIGPALDVSGSMIADARAYLDVTAAVNAWKSGQSNFGLDLRAVDTADGWAIKFTGSDSPPQLLISYTTDPVVTEDADFDGDGDVDGADFLTWQRGVGTANGGTLAQGDANGDGAINGGDLAIWQAQYGQGPAVGAAGAVPEPASAALALAVALVAGGFFRRRG